LEYFLFIYLQMGLVYLGLLITAVVLLFVSMVLSSMSSSNANKGDMDQAKKYSTASAVVTGIATFGIVVALGVHFYYAKSGGRMMGSM
jgi:hypothetical protein